MRWVLRLLFCASTACVGPSMEEPTPIPTPPVTPRENWKAEIPPQPDACAVDADCVPSSCCASATCGPIVTAPHCTGAACPDGCNPRVKNVKCGGRCICKNGCCGAILPDFSPPPKLPPG